MTIFFENTNLEIHNCWNCINKTQQNNTVIFGQCDPKKIPLQLLGKTSLRALFYFWKCFYRETEIHSKNSSKHKLQLISISVLELHLENCANHQIVKTEIFTAIKQH